MRGSRGRSRTRPGSDVARTASRFARTKSGRSRARVCRSGSRRPTRLSATHKAAEPGSAQAGDAAARGWLLWFRRLPLAPVHAHDWVTHNPKPRGVRQMKLTGAGTQTVEHLDEPTRLYLMHIAANVLPNGSLPMTGSMNQVELCVQAYHDRGMVTILRTLYVRLKPN